MAETITSTNKTTKVTAPVPVGTLPKETKTKQPKTDKPATKTRTVKRRKSRSMEELVSAATKGMTDKEKDLLIKYLKENIQMEKTRIEALRNNCEKAYAQARELEEQYRAMEDHYRTKLQYVDEQSRAFLKAVTVATRGGLQ